MNFLLQEQDYWILVMIYGFVINIMMCWFYPKMLTIITTMIYTCFLFIILLATSQYYINRFNGVDKECDTPYCSNTHSFHKKEDCLN